MLNTKYLSVFFLTIIIFLAALPRPGYSASYNPKLKYRTINTEHFAVHFPAGIEEVAELAARLAEEAHRELSPKFDWVPWGRTQVLFLDSSDSANDMASILPYNWIYLRATAPGPNDSISLYEDWLRLVIIHEYTHILHLDKVGGFWRPMRWIVGRTAAPNGVMPGWVTEGLAVFEETEETRAGRGRASYSDMLLRTAILQDEFLPIDVADGVQWKWPAGTSRYIYGVKFLEYLGKKYGKEKLYEFVDRVSRSPLLFMVNRQARQTFNDIEFETIKVHNRYAKIKKPGTPKSKTFYGLWKDWKEYLEKKYKNDEEIISHQGVSPLEILAESRGTIEYPTISPDGTKVVYAESTPYGPSRIKIVDIRTGDVTTVKKDIKASQISFSRDGKSIIYSRPGTYKRYSYVYDLYKLDLETKKAKSLTKGARAKDPDISFDGKEIVCVTQEGGTMKLNIYDVEKKELREVPVGAPQFTQYSGPRFSPDGKKIVVSVSRPGSVWDVYVYDRNGKKVKQLTNDLAIDRDSVWGVDGKSVYFTSDKTGVSNIYKYDLRTGKAKRITNVLTGVAMPAVTPNDGRLVVQYYTGTGFDLRVVDLTGKVYEEFKLPTDDKLWSEWKDTPPHPSPLPKGEREGQAPLSSDEREDSGAQRTTHSAQRISTLPYSGTEYIGIEDDAQCTAQDAQRYNSKKYNPFGKGLLLPRFIMPNFAYLDDAVMFMAITGGADPLKWHNWVASVGYRTDSQHMGYSFRYWYNRFRPIIDVGIIDYSVDFGNLTFNYDTNGDGVIDTQRTVHLYEKRQRAYGGIMYSVKQHGFRLNYFYENRRPTHVSLNLAEQNALNLGAFAGFSFLYGYNDSKEYQASISRAGGRKIKLGFTVTNTVFGSDEKNEQYIFAGDWREYVDLWGRVVWAFRASGGMAWGDQLRQGTFSMGGALGEGTFGTGGSLYYFPLRGLPIAALSRDRAMLLSSEFRFPLLYVGRGVGTSPVFLNDIYVALFADYGNAWNATQNTGKYFLDNFFLGVGAELAGDFVIGHGLPLTGRIGYGIIVVNRDRLGTLTDPIFGQSVKDGIFILQLGTSF